MKRRIMLSLVMLVLCSLVFARGYYQKVVASDPDFDILTLVTSNQTTYTAPNYTITAFFMETPTDIMSTANGTPATSLRLYRVGNGGSYPLQAMVYCELDDFVNNWVVGETLTIIVTKTDVIPNQMSTWNFVIPPGTDGIVVTNPVQQIPPEDQPVQLSAFSGLYIGEGLVQLYWTTTSEANALGYNVKRSQDNNLANAVQVNTNIIPAHNFNATISYAFHETVTDLDVTYYYWLEWISYSGTHYISESIAVNTPSLPCQLTSFTAVATPQNDVDLNWVTESENSLVGYYLYRSTDPYIDNATLVDPLFIWATNTNTPHYYSYTDTTAVSEMIYYYWLGMMGLAGEITYSDSVRVVVTNLPVILSSFTAVSTAQMYINLQWTTDIETNLLGFNVYHSTNSILENAVQVNISLIPGTNTTETHNYNFVDTTVNPNIIYYFWLQMVYLDGTSDFSNSTMAVTNSSNHDQGQSTVLSTLGNAYPNPFHSTASTNIEMNVKQGETATLDIFNIRGQKVKTYFVNERTHLIQWNGQDEEGKAVGSGVYFYKLNSQTVNIIKKLVIVK